MQQLGLGRLVKGKRRRAERLWDALDAVTGDDAYTSRARAFATELAEEDGVTAACDAIEARMT
jgi:UDP:flavonoid glycosyltransferase YjiC (YdhE family)